ncbi:MAG: hypothetical protein AAFS10_00555 [Myxococcota bacterium]
MAETALVKRKRVEKWKRYKAVGGLVLTLTLLTLSAPWWLVAGGAVGTGALTYNWFQYRASKGMYFK